MSGNYSCIKRCESPFSGDAEGRQQLARYMIRTPFALEKMTYDDLTGMVLYRSKLHATLKRSFQLLSADRACKISRTQPESLLSADTFSYPFS